MKRVAVEVSVRQLEIARTIAVLDALIDGEIAAGEDSSTHPVSEGVTYVV